MPHTHIVTAFDQDLEKLTHSLSAMGDFALAQFTDAVQAMLNGDTTLAQRVVDQDRHLDALRRDLSASAALVIARRQPMADDLDEVLADFRIVEDLERIGDLAKNIAKRAISMSGTLIPKDMVNRMDELATLAVDQLRRALSTLSSRDTAEALAVRKHDESLDELHTTIFRDIVARMGADSSQVVAYVHLLFCAKNIERIGDHAVHVAEAAYLKATGHEPETERRRLDQSSTITFQSLADDQNTPA